MSYDTGFDGGEFVDMIHLYEVDVKDNFDIDLDDVDFSEPTQKCLELITNIKWESDKIIKNDVGSSSNTAFNDIACFNGQDLDSIDEKSLLTLFREVPILDPEEYLEKDDTEWDAGNVCSVSIECKVCLREFLSRNDFLSHCGPCFNESIIEYTCKNCRRSFTRFSQFKDHYLKRVSNLHRCSTCGEELPSECQLVAHLSATHAPPPKPAVGYACNVCNRVLLMRKNLLRHMRVHASGKLYMCEVCGKLFLHRLTLLGHLANVHAGSRPHRCHLCSKWFAEESLLERHRRQVHSNERPFVCNVCSKAFKTNTALNSHSLTHSCVKRFICSKCNKGFVKISKLKEHENVHSGLKPYQCRHCQKCFTNSANLLKHRKRKHKDVIAKAEPPN